MDQREVTQTPLVCGPGEPKVWFEDGPGPGSHRDGPRRALMQSIFGGRTENTHEKVID